ncbi:MAG: sugar-binding domain-containing protein [Planctomycetota bacterium]|nr:sugar-binding domain-containing protein [Planctomycetota bacterium]
MSHHSLISHVGCVHVWAGLVFWALATSPASGQDWPSLRLDDPPAGTPSGVEMVSLAGTWELVADPGAVGLVEGWEQILSDGDIPENAPGGVYEVEVPGPLEAVRPLAAYDGVVWYRHDFTLPVHWEPGFVGLHFERVNAACSVYIDGEHIGDHEGGYVDFWFPPSALSSLVPGKSHRIVMLVVDPGDTETFGLSLKTMPHAKESWYHNYGGILGDVTLRAAVGWDGGLVARNEDGLARILGRVSGRPSAIPGDEVRLDLFMDDLLTNKTEGPWTLWRSVGADQSVSASFFGPEGPDDGPPRPQVVPWSPESPHLYRFRVLVNDVEAARTTFGSSHAEIRGGAFYLNGKERVLKGVLYQPHFTGKGGMWPSAEELEADIAQIKATGFDFIRVHVRPAPIALLDACDKLGVMVLEEPAIGWVEEHDQLSRRLRKSVVDMVVRDRRRPSVILWGLFNEMSGKGYAYVDTSLPPAAYFDGTRPVLEDSGGFLGGGRYLPSERIPSSASLRSMVDEHFYPPYPLPPEERERLRSVRSPTGGPVFVSEFGYGTRLASERAVEGFRTKEIWSEERIAFEGFAATERRAAEDPRVWAELSTNPEDAALAWLNGAQEIQADATEDLFESLRANVDLDMLCYTQWKAASYEASAGLLAPWGEARPALERARRSLRPLMVTAWPREVSCKEGETVIWDVDVVNDTGSPVPATLMAQISSTKLASSQTVISEDIFEEGVTRLQYRTEGGGVSLGLSLLSPEGKVLDKGTPRQVVAGEPAREIFHKESSGSRLTARDFRVWIPDNNPMAVATAREAGFTIFTGEDIDSSQVDVALLSQMDGLSSIISLSGRLALWHFVLYGGTAVVLLDDPAEGDVGKLLGGGRGQRTLTDLPVDIHVARAAGNFMGRTHVARVASGSWARDLLLPEGVAPFSVDTEAGIKSLGVETRLLGRNDALLSPQAMVVGVPPSESRASVITLGHLGNRIGAPVVDVAYGRGWIRCVGLPLLPETSGRLEPQRVRVLAELLAHGAWETLQVPLSERPDFTVPDSALLESFDEGLDWIATVVALADRATIPSGRTGSPALSSTVLSALRLRNKAIRALLERRPSQAATHLQRAASLVWDGETKAFLANEARVLKGLSSLMASGVRADWDLAYEVLEMWLRGVGLWFGSETVHRDTAVAFDWIGRALLRMEEIKGKQFTQATGGLIDE